VVLGADVNRSRGVAGAFAGVAAVSGDAGERQRLASKEDRMPAASREVETPAT
jgi:hypothetical protein